MLFQGFVCFVNQIILITPMLRKIEENDKIYTVLQFFDYQPNYDSFQYSKSPRIRTYLSESQAEIGSYFKGTKTNFQDIEVLI